jgi:hypothetical protein
MSRERRFGAQHSHLPTHQVLLVGKLLIGRNEQIEARFFRRRQQRPVLRA